LPGLKALASGGLMGTAFGITSGVRQQKELEDIIGQSLLMGTMGAGLGIGTHLVLENGLFKIGPKIYEKIIPEGARQTIKRNVFPVLDILNTDFGEAGKKIAQRYNLTRAETGAIAGTPTLKALEVGITNQKIRNYVPLSEEDAWLGENSLADLLQGRGSFEKATPAVQKAYTVARNIYDELGGLGTNEGVLLNKRENYMNRITPVPSKVISSDAILEKISVAKTVVEKEAILLADKYKGPILKNAVLKERIFGTVIKTGDILDANNILESWGHWVLNGGRFDKKSTPFISWLMSSGRATTINEAQVLAKNAFSDFIKPPLEPVSGFLEKAREIDFPFFNPDPRVALPAYIMDVSSRVAYLRNFGKGGMSKLLKEIETTEGYQQMKAANQYVREILGTTQKNALYNNEKAITNFVKGLQTPKLSFSAITNLGQSLNTLLSTDLKSLGYGLKVAFTDEGFKEALKSGATLQSVMHKVLGYSGGGTEFADAILKYSGFTWTENFNRTVAANSFKKYIQENVKLLKKFPNNNIIRGRLIELGLNPEDLIMKGFTTTEQEILRGMNIGAAKTQFLNDVASLPMFASSPWGQVMFQFKNYTYNQTRFVMKELGTQWRNKNYTGLVRDLAILTLVYPIYGEISSDIRSTLTNSKRPKTFLARYVSNIMNAGTFGMAFDLWNTASFGRTAEFITGPTIGTVTGFMENFMTSIDKGDISPELKFILNQTGFGRIITGYMMQPKTKRKGYGQWWEFYEEMGR
jgi:hypothetical protein